MSFVQMWKDQLFTIKSLFRWKPGLYLVAYPSVCNPSIQLVTNLKTATARVIDVSVSITIAIHQAARSESATHALLHIIARRTRSMCSSRVPAQEVGGHQSLSLVDMLGFSHM